MSELPTTGDSPQEELIDGGASAKSARGILCVKCECLNDLGTEKCIRCATHLYVFCQRCGERNPRVNSRCESCRRRLHRAARMTLRGRHGVRRLYIILGLLGILTIVVLLLIAAEVITWPPR